MQKPVPHDVAVEILELSDEGLGSNQISAFTGINSTTVKRVIAGIHQSYSNALSARQTQGLINAGFG